MTKEQVIAMAQICGDWNGETVEMNDVGIEHFATMAGNAKLEEAKHIDWTQVMREGQLVTWGDASTLGYRVFEKLESLKEPTT